MAMRGCSLPVAAPGANSRHAQVGGTMQARVAAGGTTPGRRRSGRLCGAVAVNRRDERHGQCNKFTARLASITAQCVCVL